MQKKETFWQVFLRKDNIAIPLIFLILVVTGLSMHRENPEDGGLFVIACAAVMLLIDVVCVYRGLNRNR